ncbi:hypothetical protein EVAR_35465_1 [Eumeta japonica]|uniref:Uncharacterized protein n=1 Tax=Eumeta variegata TaxID=151549 RepID=A0A4C1XNJ6_EUMVA|nr:hypothetical protein EVAR_35465_1 [Eumeta japonica]
MFMPCTVVVGSDFNHPTAEAATRPRWLSERRRTRSDVTGRDDTARAGTARWIVIMFARYINTISGGRSAVRHVIAQRGTRFDTDQGRIDRRVLA